MTPHTTSKIHWRWDQGRLDYFRFDEIRRIAVALRSLDNVRLDLGPDPLREPLMHAAELPFSPRNYRVWRNYKRVFGCCFLATSVSGRLICTDLCHQLAESGPNTLSVDEYFAHLIRHLSFPSPVFENYQPSGKRVFPLCAVLKLLLARLSQGHEPRASLTEIVEYVVANQCTGEESLSHYASLLPASHRFAGDEERQIRELLTFASQVSILKWERPFLVLDIDSSRLAFNAVLDLSQPSKLKRKTLPHDELLSISRRQGSQIVTLERPQRDESDVFVMEGGKKRSTHVRIERSGRLRALIFSKMKA
jgi:hypothetical protein